MKRILYVLYIFIILPSPFFGIQGELQDSPLVEKLGFAIQLPILCSPPTVDLSGEEIVNQVRPILKSRIRSMNYDRILPMLQFLEHFEALKKVSYKVTPIEAFKSFKFDPLPHNHRGGRCVTLTLDLFRFLPKHLNPYVSIAKLPDRYQQFGFPEYAHSVILIKYMDPDELSNVGFVLLDPSFDIGEPILLRKKGIPFYYDTEINGMWKFYLDEDEIICEIINEKQKENKKIIYKTEKVVNPIECSAMPMILADRKLSLLSRKEHKFAHLNIQLNKERIVWNKDGERFSPISFSKIKKGWFFPFWFSNDLFMENSYLRKMVFKILENKKVLDSLYFDYMNLIKKTEDFSITGELDLEKLDCILKNFEK